MSKVQPPLDHSIRTGDSMRQAGQTPGYRTEEREEERELLKQIYKRTSPYLQLKKRHHGILVKFHLLSEPVRSGEVERW